MHTFFIKAVAIAAFIALPFAAQAASVVSPDRAQEIVNQGESLGVLRGEGLLVRYEGITYLCLFHIDQDAISLKSCQEVQAMNASG